MRPTAVRTSRRDGDPSAAIGATRRQQYVEQREGAVTRVQPNHAAQVATRRRPEGSPARPRPVLGRQARAQPVGRLNDLTEATRPSMARSGHRRFVFCGQGRIRQPRRQATRVDDGYVTPASPSRVGGRPGFWLVPMNGRARSKLAARASDGEVARNLAAGDSFGHPLRFEATASPRGPRDRITIFGRHLLAGAVRGASVRS